MQRLSRYCPLLSLALLLLLPAVSRADTVYSTFGSGQTFNTSAGGWALFCNAPSCGAFQDVAAAFTPTGTFTLTQIDVAASYLSGTNGIEVMLLSDASGTPGSILESWSLSDLPPFGTSFTPESVTAALPITLNSGTQYWVALVPSVGGFLTWNFAPTLVGTTDVLGSSTGPNWAADSNQFLPAYDVLGTPVATPEPSSLLMLWSGLLAVCGTRLRRKRMG